jgi:hypothetical protein
MIRVYDGIAGEGILRVDDVTSSQLDGLLDEWGGSPSRYVAGMSANLYHEEGGEVRSKFLDLRRLSDVQLASFYPFLLSVVNGAKSGWWEGVVEREMRNAAFTPEAKERLRSLIVCRFGKIADVMKARLVRVKRSRQPEVE